MASLNIDPDSIKPNSHKYRDEQAENAKKEARDRLTPVVKKGGVVSTKKPLSQKFADTFMTEDTSDIKSYILMDVIIPGIKNTVLDVLEMAFFGTASGSKKRKNNRSDSRTDYRSYYDSSSTSSRRDRDRRRRDDSYERRRDKLDYRNIVLLDRKDAEDVIDNMHRLIKKHGVVSIAELLELIGEEKMISHNDNNWGWTDERDIGIRRVSRGYLIDVAEAEYID